MEWEKIRKIDGHVHILPKEVHNANPEMTGEFCHAVTEEMISRMDRYNIESAVIMPFNDPFLMSNAFTVEAVHENLREMKRLYPGRFYAFADIDVRNSVEDSVRSILTSGLDGLKIHPQNTGMNADDIYYISVLKEVSGLPVTIHCYPDGEDDVSAARRIAALAEMFPGITFIAAHIGALQWERLLDTNVYVEMSSILPDYIRVYGTEKTNRIFRSFGADRLIYGSDYPTSRLLYPSAIDPFYFGILNQMDFNEEEKERIAYGNMKKILGDTVSVLR